MWVLVVSVMHENTRELSEYSYWSSRSDTSSEEGWWLVPVNAEKGPGVTLLLVVLLASALLEGERVDSVALALSLCDGERQF